MFIPDILSSPPREEECRRRVKELKRSLSELKRDEEAEVNVSTLIEERD